jgi:hypothetical protein
MIAPLARLLDWSVLQGIGCLPFMRREPANEGDLKLEQAVQFLNGPDFIPAESPPAQLDFGPDASSKGSGPVFGLRSLHGALGWKDEQAVESGIPRRHLPCHVPGQCAPAYLPG